MKIEIKPSTSLKGDLSAEKTIKWIGASGKATFIEDMPDKHLSNAIQFIKKHNNGDPYTLGVLECMKLERNRREYARGGEIEIMITNRKISISNSLKQNKELLIFK